MKNDCKVQTLALKIVTLFNECTGRLSRVSTRHKHTGGGRRGGGGGGGGGGGEGLKHFYS